MELLLFLTVLILGLGLTFGSEWHCRARGTRKHANRQAIETFTEATRTEKLKNHARQVRGHIIQLSNKRYWGQSQPAPECVFLFLFLPGEIYFSAALQHDPSLIELGVDKRVTPSIPLMLLTLLRAVAYSWRQETTARNAMSDLGRELYARVQVIDSHFRGLTQEFTHSVKSYNRTVLTLKSRTLPTARRIKKLEVSANNPIPEQPPVDHTPPSLQSPENANLFNDLTNGQAAAVVEKKD